MAKVKIALAYNLGSCADHASHIGRQDHPIRPLSPYGPCRESMVMPTCREDRRDDADDP